MIEKKFKSQKKIIEISKNLKKQGKKIVTYNGSFDLLHLGHINSLKEAKKQGDILIVLLNSDKSIKSYKGSNRPIVPQKERVEMISALECVDYVAIFEEINPKEILEKIKPDIHCNGSDWGRDCLERKLVEENGGKIHILKWVLGLSTSQLIEKIIKAYSRSDIKAVFLDREGTININEPEFVHRIEDFKFTPGAITALQNLSKTNYKIIIITNQSGIGRGYFSLKDLKKLHRWLLIEFKKKKIRIDRIYYCPHGPEDNCSCRKPKIGLIMKAVKDFGIRLDKSWVIGDGEVDVILGREANVKTIKIGEKMSKKLKLEPNFYAPNLLEAVKIVL